VESEVETARISPRSVLKASKLQIKFECPVCCVRVKSHSHHQMERAEGAPKGPERVASSDDAKESVYTSYSTLPKSGQRHIG
jgi:hypothetical protein